VPVRAQRGAYLDRDVDDVTRFEAERLRVAPRLDERGFTLIEVITAGIIAVIAVLGLAYSFSAGRGMVDRYASAREALAIAEQRMERLSMLGLRNPGDPDLAPGPHGPIPHSLHGNGTGVEEWTVTWVNDPADNAGGDANPNDYKAVVARVRWTSGPVQDTVQLSRIILGS
jgi:type II secretory pathway pseudopilin PulG